MSETEVATRARRWAPAFGVERRSLALGWPPRYRVVCRLPEHGRAGGVRLEFTGWVIGSGRGVASRETVTDGKLRRERIPTAVVSVFLTANGDIVTAVALDGDAVSAVPRWDDGTTELLVTCAARHEGISGAARWLLRAAQLQRPGSARRAAVRALQRAACTVARLSGRLLLTP